MTLQERLDAGAVKAESGCIEWVRHKNADGYGMLWLNGGAERTHRAAWIAKHGAIPKGMHVLHKCDNRCCINADHLFLGTNTENVADKVAKNRQSRSGAPVGEGNGMTPLTTDDVVQIKSLLKRADVTYRALALLFDVSVMTICNIKTGRTWSHVQEAA